MIKINFKKIFLLNLAVFSALLFNACSLIEMKNQTEFADNLAVIKGNVSLSATAKTINNDKIIIVLMKQFKNTLLKRISYVTADQDGGYSFRVAPGTYVVGAFADSNKDNHYQDNELGDVYGKPNLIKVVANQVVTANVVIKTNFKKQIAYDPYDFDQTHLSLKNIGKVVSLDDDRFKQENGSLGLWRPIDFLKDYGAGLFLLQKYNNKKIPVIFVHGANGGSDDWKTIITSMNNNRFQPWVYNYPSGMRLDGVSSYLNRAVDELQNKYNMNKIYVVSHSMGGLVMRSFLVKYHKNHPEQFKKIKFAMTINSPMMGMGSAGSGVKYSPILVPSWRDITPESLFLKTIHAWQWPKNLPYHLVFSYMSGDGDDGVVDLESQIPLKLQLEATRVYGFNASHAGILKDEAFIKHFNQILNRSF